MGFYLEMLYLLLIIKKNTEHYRTIYFWIFGNKNYLYIGKLIMLSMYKFLCCTETSSWSKMVKDLYHIGGMYACNWPLETKNQRGIHFSCRSCRIYGHRKWKCNNSRIRMKFKENQWTENEEHKFQYDSIYWTGEPYSKEIS